MKKLVCIILCSILLISTPFKGYASSAVFFGMSEEVVLGFLASLLGIQAKQTISSYDDLLDYNNDLRYGFTEYLAGSATSMELAEWIGEAVLGKINTDSIIWEKFYSYCNSQYIDLSSGDGITVDTTFSDTQFNFQYFNDVEIIRNETSGGNTYTTEYYYDIAVNVTPASYANRILYCSNNQIGGYTRATTNGNQTYRYDCDCPNSYTYDGRTVYYGVNDLRGSFPVSIPSYEIQSGNFGKAAWLMIYGGFVAPSANIGALSGALTSVLSDSVVDNIIDGTSVLQLYNPAASQNGLHIVPDPEDPQDIVIPAMLTADWYNFLQQFGSGAQSFVNAYNALNAVEGVSTGAINGVYNNLGIASALNTAAAAAQGTLSLTDNNIFPQVSTVADAVTGVIPGALTPVAPDSGITNDSDQGLYKLPDLRDYFPFCIPFDLIDLLSCFVADPETPEFIIALSDGTHLTEHEISLESFNNIASIVRTLELAVFILGLMLITRNLIRG